MFFASSVQKRQCPVSDAGIDSECLGYLRRQISRRKLAPTDGIPAARLQAIALKVLMVPGGNPAKDRIAHHVPGKGTIPDLDELSLVYRIGLERDPVG